MHVVVIDPRGFVRMIVHLMVHHTLPLDTDPVFQPVVVCFSSVSLPFALAGRID